MLFTEMVIIYNILSINHNNLCCLVRFCGKLKKYIFKNSINYFFLFYFYNIKII